MTELMTVFSFMIANGAFVIPVFLWNRFETQADIRRMNAQLESTRELIRAIHDEIKDFHARLCVIEERNKK